MTRGVKHVQMPWRRRGEASLAPTVGRADKKSRLEATSSFTSTKFWGRI
jgi:hypothetical protein